MVRTKYDKKKIFSYNIYILNFHIFSKFFFNALSYLSRYKLTKNTYGFYKFTEILNKHPARFFKHPGFPKILINNLIENKKKNEKKKKKKIYVLRFYVIRGFRRHL